MTDRDRDMRQTRGCSSLLFFIVVPFEALKCLSSHMERESDPQSISRKGFTPWAKGVKLNRPPERNPYVIDRRSWADLRTDSELIKLAETYMEKYQDSPSAQRS